MSIRSVALVPENSLVGTAAAGVLLSLLLVVSAKAQVPFWPVPMTLQTLTVLIIGGLLGARLGLAAMAAYLLEGAAGLPVFAGTPAHGIGLAYMAGPTGGYLVGLTLAMAWTGLVGQRLTGRPLALAAAMMGAVALNYLPGIAWLASFVGWQRAWVAGAVPFIAADMVKAAIATCILLAARDRA